jgi:hypothetical protein
VVGIEKIMRLRIFACFQTQVVVIKDKELRLETSRIEWQNSTEVLTTEPEDKVVIYRMDGTVTVGKNLMMDQRGNIIKLDEGLTQTPKTFDEEEGDL